MRLFSWYGLFLFVTLGVPAQAEVSFVRDIAPIVLKRCTGCHGERTNLGGYRAHTFRDLMRPGASGKPSIAAGKPAASRLFQLITAPSAATRMPQSDDPLAPAQIALFRAWIAGGARFDGTDPALPLKSLLGPRTHPAAPAVYRAPTPILALALAPGGSEVFVGGYHEITVWNTDTGALARRLPSLPQRIQALTFDPAGRRLLVGGGTPGEYGELTLVDTATGRRKVLDTFNDIVLTAVFSPDGTRIAAGSADTSVRVYAADTGMRLWAANLHSDWVTSVSFSFDGRFLASASKDMTVKVYEAANGALFTTYNGHNRQIGQYRGQFPVYAVRFAPDSLLACSAGGGNWIQVWDPVRAREEAGDAGDMEERFAKQGHTRYIAHGFQHEVFALAVRDGQVFAASADGLVKQFDLGSLKVVRVYPGVSDWLFGLDYDSVSHRVVAGSYRGEVRVWDTRTGRSLTVFQATPGIHPLAASPLPSPTTPSSQETTGHRRR